MTKKYFTLAVVLSLFFLESATWGQDKMPPARIGGVLITANIRPSTNGMVVVDTTQIMKGHDSGYTFAVTRQDGTSLISGLGYEAKDTDGLNEHDCYTIDIPIYNEKDQPNGAKSGDVAMIHVYKDGFELPVIFPPDGLFVVGESRFSKGIDLVVGKAKSLSSPKYLKDACDVNGDGKSGLEDAIRILQTLSESSES